MEFKNRILGVPILGNIARIVWRWNMARSRYRKQLRHINWWSFQQTENTNFYYDLTPLNLVHLRSMLNAITGIEHDQIQGLIDELRRDDDLRKFIKEGLELAKYPKDIKVDFSRRIGWYVIVRLTKPKLVVETGVDHGVGACVLAAALKRNSEEGNPGRYIGTDINPHAGKLFRDPLSKFGEILYGDSIESLFQIEDEIDLFINDSDHSEEYEYEEYKAVETKLSSNAILLGDNSHVTDKLAMFAEDTGRNFVFFSETPLDHWYPGAGIGICYTKN